MSTLFLVATPIGNLQDISPRALDTLRGVSLIAAEDTRTARQLLHHFEIATPVTSFFEHSKSPKINQLLASLESGDIAVISEAGTPGINDPGFELVEQAIALGHRISPIPGATAVLTALVASGISAGAFYYAGFLPREPQARRRLLRDLASERDTLVAFETPHRLRDALADLENIFGASRQICIARELTKMFEEFQRGTISEVRAHFLAQEPRGEFTLVIAGRATDTSRPMANNQQRKTNDLPWNEARVKREFQKLTRAGVPRSDAVKQISRAAKWDRRRVYQITMIGETRK